MGVDKWGGAHVGRLISYLELRGPCCKLRNGEGEVGTLFHQTQYVGELLLNMEVGPFKMQYVGELLLRMEVGLLLSAKLTETWTIVTGRGKSTMIATFLHALSY